MTNTTPTEESAAPPLKAALDHLRSEAAVLRTPPRVEATLMAAFAARQKKLKRQRWINYFAVPGLTAGAALVAVLLVAPRLQVSAPAAEADGGADLVAYMAAADTPFVALVPLEEVQSADTPHMVQMNVPRLWLSSSGVPVDPGSAGDTVRAEMLVSAEGKTLAIRLMP